MNTNELQYKLVEFAYPSSPTAIKAGYGDTGCWYVSLYTDSNTCINGLKVAFSQEQKEAVEHANTLPQEWSKNRRFFNY